ncbi:pentatricopeptide repeat-containing protein At2g03380, mitochondrial-like [Selaginella moellendorffii]|uniref:pentatricopeptide repeat-containing protein At2g03380, mitochondrial-like n=1 Tax=Selaginella moellendorffii TaxID=88036 RepID=UPI000D1C601F|nr:pentatricopeptide repeat-containing protein At2g03380, mitochondrial-like [Selaginella moellendorffii]|eukprot:XP_024531263.1 pentatricopeptide repeat-containing protein At2g03380, mitochondrial-like [Selaginella moellendorffii]
MLGRGGWRRRWSISGHRHCSTGNAGNKVSTSILLSRLKACTSSGDIKAGRILHARAKSSGDDANIHVATALVNLYCKSGCLAEARSVFEAMPAKSTVASTALMLGYIEGDQSGVAMELFSRMIIGGCDPDARAFVAALKACAGFASSSKDSTLERGLEIHWEASRRGYAGDIFVANTAMDLFSRCGGMVEAKRVFDGIASLSRNVVSWTVLVAGYAENGCGEAGLEVFSRMMSDPARIRPDALTFVAAVKCVTSMAVALTKKASSSKNFSSKVLVLEKGMEIHLMAAKAGVDSHLVLSNSLVDMYSKCGDLAGAVRVFEKMAEHSVVSWTSLVLGFVDNGEDELALELFDAMTRVEGCVPDAPSIVAALKACASAAAKEEGRTLPGVKVVVKLEALERSMAIHSQAARSRNLDRDVRVGNMLVDLYAKCGSVLDSRRVFDVEMRHRDVVSWNSLMMGYADCGEGEMALELFSCLDSQGCEHDVLSFVAALKACSSTTALESAKKIHARVLSCEESIEPSDLSVVKNCLLDVYGKCGSMVDAQIVFDSLETRSSLNWSSVVAGYGRKGDTRWVFEMFDKMVEEGWVPDRVSCLSVLTACSHAGLIDRGKKFFQRMSSQWRVSLSLEHYRCVIDMLGRANELEQAVAMVEGMEFRADALTWRTVLGACWKWKNAVVGRRVFEELVKLDKRDYAAYVLMGNIYGSLGMRDEQALVDRMKTS